MTTHYDLDFHGDLELDDGLVDLAVNVRPDAPPRWLRQVIGAADLSRYPDQVHAVAAVAARHGRQPEEVLLTAGAAEAFVLIARAFDGERAVVVHPQFTEPEAALITAGHKVERVVLPPPFVLDASLVPADADLVVIGNPTNPTSVLHPARTITSLARPGRLVVVDEAFADCVPGEPQSLAAEGDLGGLAVIRSLTKTWGLAGLRVGYVLAAQAIIERLRDAQPPWPVSSPALAAAVACSQPAAAAEAEQWAKTLSADRDHLLTSLADIEGVRVLSRPSASFVLLQADRPDLRSALRERGFAVRRGETFPGLDERWIRIAVRDPATTNTFADALRSVLR